MASTVNSDNGVVSGSAGLKTSADSTGVLALQSNGTTGLTLNTSGAIGVGSGNSTGTNGQVLTSAGSGAAPTWATAGASAATPTALGTVYGNQTSGGGTPFLTALGYNAAVSSTGANNVAIGTDALYSTTSSTQKTAVGYQAGYSGTSTNGGLTAIGYQAGYSDTNPYGANDANLYVGYRAGYNNTTPNAQTFIGVGAGFTKSGTGGLCTLVGSNAGYYLTTGAGNTCLGYGTMNNATTISYSVAIGDRCMGTGVATGTYNVGVGHVALQELTSGNGNTAVGMQSLNKNTSGSKNSAVGQNSLYSNTTATENSALGYGALQNTTTGYDNSALGIDALKSNTTGYNNSATGGYALTANTTGYGNSAYGYIALTANTTGYSNSALGTNALLTNTTGLQNTGCGNATLYSATTGNNNTALGEEALFNMTTGSNNTGLGFNAGVEAGVVNITTQSNHVVIGNVQVSNAYIKVAWTVTSDSRDKTEVQPVPHGLSFVNQLNPVSFKFKKSRDDATPTGDVRYGFLAQDVLALEGSDSVVIDSKDSENLKYTDQNMTAILVKAIQELKAEFDLYKSTHP